ncbi:hypothetical protein BJ322DRAFT_1025088 [Thelephora terrestris]|uniref:Ribonuclease H1 N-terminal domain-containing protein n=1 Tax=Thelephora terrestris TaxID=56493 RepID=A0A9P6L1M6_9AGAM|nr:hypothetical protein BJ322DRAFT_1025088 [Thelephora terrestris]
MDTDEALARALDEVLSLSGGDPRKVLPGAMDALNASLLSRDSETFATEGYLDSFNSHLPYNHVSFAGEGFLDSFNGHLPYNHVSFTGRCFPINFDCHLPHKSFAGKDDIFYTSPSATSHHLPPSGPRVEDHAPTTLHPVLAEIQHDESKLPLSDFIGLKRVIEANPYYLREPYHINVRNSQGSLKNRRMKRPPPGSPTPEKWFAVARGSELGVFLDWLVVNPLVTGKSRSNFKSFRDEYVWLQACLLRGTLELIN